MKRNIVSLLGIILLGLPLSAQEAPDKFPPEEFKEENYMMRFTARLIDDNGKALPNFPIHIRIENFNDYRDNHNDFHGHTDAEGKFSAEGLGRPMAQIIVLKEGYYRSQEWVSTFDHTKEQEIRKTGRYLPWDPLIDVMVRKIGNPIPMRMWIQGCVEHSHQIPAIGKETGFDLFEKDWVVPHGKGKVTDLLIRFENKFLSIENYQTDCFIRFKNPHDGYIPIPTLVSPQSDLRFPRTAPLEGYDLKNLHLTRIVRPYKVGEQTPQSEKTIIKEPVGYLVRYRTLIDEKTQEVVSARYGLIFGSMHDRNPDGNPFVISPGKSERHPETDVPEFIPLPIFKFGLLLNPTSNDRNLEYNRRDNLAPQKPAGTSPR